MECEKMVNIPMNAIKTQYKNDDGASIGIGAMIVFIALILVAAVASTIIIKTAEELQQRAEATGDDTRDEISGKLQIVMAYVSEDDGLAATVDVMEVTLIVQMAAGSDQTLLSDISWLIVCNDGTATVDTNTGSLDDGTNVFAEALDGTAMAAGASVTAGQTFAIVIDTNDNGNDDTVGANAVTDGCQAGVGDNQELRLIVDGGGETYSQLTFNSVESGSMIV
jgi:archaellin